MQPKKRIVIKCGGSSLAQITALQQCLYQLQQWDYEIILVHGGGNEVTECCQQLNIPQQTLNGLRVTSEPVLEIAKMILIGKINCNLVHDLNRYGLNTIGLSGCDSDLLVADYINRELFAEVGEIKQVNTQLLTLLLVQQIIPVIAPIAVRLPTGFLNVNADHAAAAIAIAINADRLILLSDIDGYYSNYPDPNSLQSQLTECQINTLLNTPNKILNGMHPKLTAALLSIRAGVSVVNILNRSKVLQLPKILQNRIYCGTRIIKEEK